eukprot:8705363-Alexandrium_andersonii.AAC.1
MWRPDLEISRPWAPPWGRSAGLLPGRGLAGRSSRSPAVRSSPECDSGEDVAPGFGKFQPLGSAVGPVRGFASWARLHGP